MGMTGMTGMSNATGISLATTSTMRTHARKTGNLRQTAKAVACQKGVVNIPTVREDNELGVPEVTKELALVPSHGIRRGIPIKNGEEQKSDDGASECTSTAIVVASQQVAIHHSQQAQHLAMTLTSGWTAASPYSSLGFTNKKPLLVVRFEAFSRWSGVGRSKQRPLAKATAGPSPVTCLTALVSSVVAGHASGNVCIWDITGCSLLPLHHFEAHKIAVSSLAYLPAMDCLLSTSMGETVGENAQDSTLRVWDCSTLECRQIFPLHSALARCMQTLKLPGARKAPCVVIGCDARNMNQLHLMKAGEKRLFTAAQGSY